MLRHVALAGSLAGLLLASAPAHADARGNQLAYNYALRCFVAGGILVGQMRHHGGTQAEITASENASKTAFNAAYKLGSILGYTEKRVSADMDGFQRSEARRLVLESGYMASTRAECARLGLMTSAS